MQSTATMWGTPVNVEIEQGKHFLADFLKILNWLGHYSSFQAIASFHCVLDLTSYIFVYVQIGKCQMPTSLACKNHYEFKFMYSWVEECQPSKKANLIFGKEGSQPLYLKANLRSNPSFVFVYISCIAKGRKKICLFIRRLG